MKPKIQTYGQAVRRLLDELGWSAYKLGQVAGVTGASLSLILSDERKPSVETVEKLLRAAGKSWVWLDENLEACDMAAGAAEKERASGKGKRTKGKGK